MKVDLLDRDMVDSDLGVVNAARCSFDKQSQWYYTCKKHGDIIDPICIICEKKSESKRLQQKDVKLISYLVTHAHWTPFSHSQEVFELYLDEKELSLFLFHANLSGFEWCHEIRPWKVRGSLYAWLTNYQHLPKDISHNVLTVLLEKYPESTRTLYIGEHFTSLARYEPTRVMHGIDNKEPELQVFTLRISCPIFVKRQLETHRRNFIMTDIADFSQNEVSRRYVDTEPEIYHPTSWRLQAQDKKQGSSELHLTGTDHFLVSSNYYHTVWSASRNYVAMNARGIAHEQSRMILPLSTYTTFWWTGSLKSWQRFFDLRLKPDVQNETRDIAEMCYTSVHS